MFANGREVEALREQLAAAHEKIAELRMELQRASSRDRLGEHLLSLPAFLQHLELDATRAAREGQPLSLILLDVDGFRALNARHGQRLGDEVLAAVGQLLSTRSRAGDLGCRTAADEFALVLRRCSLEAAASVAERLLTDLEAVRVGPVDGLSASAGVATLAPGGDVERLLAEAGQALLAAREAGGGRVACRSAAEGAPAETAAEEEHDGEVVAVLASALEERDRYTGDHSLSLVELAGRVASSMGLGADEVAMVRKAALLHDIGKIGIPDAILHKPGPLNDREWEVMRQHPVIGERILRAIPGMGQVARIVRHEHERWDGCGYPDGLAGEEIPLGSRIILACDAYHAMVSDRPYSKGMSHAEALAELHGNAGSQFDVAVVEALIGCLYCRRQAGVAAV